MLPEIIVGLRHLLDVEHLCPALVTAALSGLQLRLDVDEQRVLFRVACVRFCAAYAPFLRQERRADRPLYSRLWKKDGQSPFYRDAAGTAYSRAA